MRRLRINVRHVSPGHVDFAVFQSDNGGVNWGKAGDLCVSREWFEEVFGSGQAEEGARFEVELGQILAVEEKG